MDSMDSMEHSHIPYAVLLVRALERFKVSQRVARTYDKANGLRL
jgi:amyloid beta precursor protein binding protein 1